MADKSEKQVVVFGILILTLTASIPIMVNYNVFGEELAFHMMRIEAMADSFRFWNLPVRLESSWLAGHGYASSVFCGNIYLLVPALLRMMGLSLDCVYRIYILLVNLLTACVSYLSFSKCFQSRYIGIMGCALYTLAPFRVYNLYNRAAVGEYTAMIFLPLLVWGFYRIYMEEPDKKGYGLNWIIPVIGFSGVLQSNMHVCMMAAVFAVLLSLVLWKKTFRRRTFLVLLGVAGVTVMVNAWFLVPYWDLLGADRYYFSNNEGMLIQSRGILPAHLFYTLQAGGTSSDFAANGMLDTEPLGPGMAMLLCLGLWPVLRGRQKAEASGQEKRAGDIGFILTILALFMSTRYFPWDYLSSCGKPFAVFAGFLQYPARMLTIAVILGVFSACMTGACILREKLIFMQGRTALILIALVAVVFGNYQVNSILLTRQAVRSSSIPDIDGASVPETGYLPVEAEMEHMVYHAPVLSEGTAMEHYEKDGLDVRAEVSASREGYIEFPMLYYKGYRAIVQETGERLPAEKGDNCDVRVSLPAGFGGHIRVWYAGMWYWHLAEVLSVIAGCVLLCYSLKVWRKR